MLLSSRNQFRSSNHNRNHNNHYTEILNCCDHTSANDSYGDLVIPPSKIKQLRLGNLDLDRRPAKSPQPSPTIPRLKQKPEKKLVIQRNSQPQNWTQRIMTATSTECIVSPNSPHSNKQQLNSGTWSPANSHILLHQTSAWHPAWTDSFTRPPGEKTKLKKSSIGDLRQNKPQLHLKHTNSSNPNLN